jgi:hypothetical protein
MVNLLRTPWKVAFLVLMVLGLAAAVYHATSGRWANAVIAACASLLGVFVILTDRTVAAPREPRRRWRREPGAPLPGAAEAAQARRAQWLSGGVIAGFVATVVMSLALLIAYLIAGGIGSETGNRVDRWFAGLSDNHLTSGIYDVPIAAFSVNLLAGLAWALVYARFVEERLPGPGWRRGMLFSIVPWLLSLVVFFPLVGAGFFGAGLNAGPLPALGNLVLHLLYGAVLGTVYAIPDISSATSVADQRAAKLENDGTAIGLVGGLTLGLVVGAIASAIFAGDRNAALNITLAGGGFGTVAGALIGPFLGLQWGEHHGPHPTGT